MWSPVKQDNTGNLAKWVVIVGVTLVGGYWIYQLLTQILAETLAKPFIKVF